MRLHVSLSLEIVKSRIFRDRIAQLLLLYIYLITKIGIFFLILYSIYQVDRCVTGLVAQQQCVGPLHTPLADFAIIALSYNELVGSATSIGTQNIKGLLNPAAGARMSLGEALTNLVSGF